MPAIEILALGSPKNWSHKFENMTPKLSPTFLKGDFAMPFDPTTQINPNPDVKIFFEGLVMLVPGQDAKSKRCDVYVINHSSEHELSVDVSVDQPQPNFPFLRLGSKVLRSGLEISTKTPAGVTKYVPNGGTSVPGAYGFDEAIDFNLLHPGVKPDPTGAHSGVLKIRDGVLYTVTQRDKDARLERQTECRNCVPLSLILGASIDLGGKKLVLDWGEDSLELPRAEDPAGTKYFIWINNSRPVPATTNDFQHLYHGISPVATPDKFRLVFKHCGDPLETSPRVPCIPGVTGG